MPPALQQVGGRRAVLAATVTIKIHEVTTRVRALAHSPARGARECVSPGDLIAVDADGALVTPQGLALPG